MVTFNRKKVGFLLVLFSVLLLVSLILIKADIDSNKVFLCDAVHNNPDMEMVDCPAHNSNTSWLLVVVFGVGFIFFGFGLYMMFVTTSTKQLNESISQEVDTSTLDDEEKKVYELLKSKEGSMYQSDLIKELDYSKVKMTRVLDKMESKKLIDRRRRGMTNIIILR